MLEAAENLRINQPVAEYTGRVMLREEFEEFKPTSWVEPQLIIIRYKNSNQSVNQNTFV